MPEPNYDQGFRDGVMFVTKQLRAAADLVEKPTRGEFETKEGTKITAITRSGQPIFAQRLRGLADEIERTINQ